LIGANPPSVPALSSPADNVLMTTYAPALNWSDATGGGGVDHYQVQLATGSTFGSIVRDEDVPSSYWTVTPDLSANTTYWWRVRSYNAAGQYSLWSAARRLRTVMVAPLPAWPSDGETLLTTRPPFDWGDVAGASSYAVQVSTAPDFATKAVNVTSTPSTYTPTVDLPKGVTLYWRVRANGTNGPSAWSTPRIVTSANPPSVPVLVSPATGSLAMTYTPVFDWGDATNGLDHYQVQIATNSSFGAVAQDATVAASSYTPSPGLNPNATYWWRVRSYNAGGAFSLWSSVRTLRTVILVPSLLTPADGAIVTSLRPAFDWTDAAGASSYTLQVSTNAQFSSLVVNVSPTTSSYTPTANLPTNKVLDVRLRANGSNGPTAWTYLSFIIIP
jgi:hypothetical protein